MSNITIENNKIHKNSNTCIIRKCIMSSRFWNTAVPSMKFKIDPFLGV